MSKEAGDALNQAAMHGNVGCGKRCRVTKGIGRLAWESVSVNMYITSEVDTATRRWNVASAT